jgi:exopolyphosphatase/guanosine-5'-triphosphate,3'-diphosphate pyrophosphatase
MKYASIDVGTNAVLLLIAKQDNGISDIIDISSITRTFYILEKYRNIINENHVGEIFCVGTSALREAENAEVFLETIREKLGLTVRVISEYDEAYYTYLSVKNDELITDKNVIIVDIGGGSTEIIKGDSQEFFDFISLPIGTVKLTEMFIKHNPPHNDELSSLKTYSKDLLLKLLQG